MGVRLAPTETYTPKQKESMIAWSVLYLYALHFVISSHPSFLEAVEFTTTQDESIEMEHPSLLFFKPVYISKLGCPEVEVDTGSSFSFSGPNPALRPIPTRLGHEKPLPRPILLPSVSFPHRGSFTDRVSMKIRLLMCVFNQTKKVRCSSSVSA